MIASGSLIFVERRSVIVAASTASLIGTSLRPHLPLDFHRVTGESFAVFQAPKMPRHRLAARNLRFGRKSKHDRPLRYFAGNINRQLMTDRHIYSLLNGHEVSIV